MQQNGGDIARIDYISRQIIPKAERWQENYNVNGRRFLNPLSQAILDLRLNFILHFLQKHTLYMHYKNPQHEPMEFLSPLLFITSSWLDSSLTQTDTNGRVLPQRWKGCFKYQYSLALTALFEFFRFCATTEACEKNVIDLVCQNCRKILEAKSKQAPIVDLGTILFENMWKKYYKCNERMSGRH